MHSEGIRCGRVPHDPGDSSMGIIHSWRRMMLCSAGLGVSYGKIDGWVAVIQGSMWQLVRGPIQS